MTLSGKKIKYRSHAELVSASHETLIRQLADQGDGYMLVLGGIEYK